MCIHAVTGDDQTNATGVHAGTTEGLSHPSLSVEPVFDTAEEVKVVGALIGGLALLRLGIRLCQRGIIVAA